MGPPPDRWRLGALSALRCVGNWALHGAALRANWCTHWVRCAALGTGCCTALRCGRIGTLGCGAVRESLPRPSPSNPCEMGGGAGRSESIFKISLVQRTDAGVLQPRTCPRARARHNIQLGGPTSERK